jgi:hypothetical protein
LFLGELIQYLNTGTSGGIDIRDKVRLFNFRQDNKGDKGIKNGHKSDPTVSLPSVTIRLREDEEMKLSEILIEIEEKTGKQERETDIQKSVIQRIERRCTSAWNGTHGNGSAQCQDRYHRGEFILLAAGLSYSYVRSGYMRAT